MTLGIDLGTSRTRVWDARRPANTLGSVPTAVAYLPDGVLVGQPALDAAFDGRAELVTDVVARLGEAAGYTHPATAVARDLLGHLPVAPGRTLTSLAGTAVTTVFAVPDPWLHRGSSGGLARDRLTRVVRDELGLPAPGFVGQSVATAAGLAVSVARPGSSALLVCDVGATTVSVALTVVDTAAVRLVDVVTGTGVPNSSFEHRVVTALVVDALASPGSALAGPASASPGATLAGLRQAMRTQGSRATVVLPRALAVPRYRDAPAYRWNAPGGPVSVTAGMVLDCYEPVAAAIRAGVRRVLAATKTPDDLVCAVAGGLGGLPLTQAAVREGLAAAVRRPPKLVTVLDEAVAARGAALIAAGTVRAEQPTSAATNRVAVSLPVHRVAGGRLRVERFALTGHVGATAAPDGMVVEVPEPAGRALEVDVHDRPGGSPRALDLAGATVPAGRYIVRLWPNRGDLGALALTPVAGGDPLMYALPDPEGEP